MRLVFILVVVFAPVVAIAGPSVTVDGDSLCPSPSDVATAVTLLLPDDALTTAPARARVDQAGSDLRLRVWDRQGARVAERQLQATESCPERAEIVAVTIAAWLTRLQPEPLPTLRLAPARETPAPRGHQGAVAEVGMGVAAAVADGGAAPGARLLLSLYAGAHGPGVLLHAGGTTGRAVTVGSYTASWRRWHVTVGPSYQAPIGGRWRFAASVGFSAGWLSAEGITFPQNFSSTRFSPGVAGLIQLAHPFATWSPWLAIGASAAIVERQLTVSGTTDQRALQPMEFDVGLGASLRWLP